MASAFDDLIRHERSKVDFFTKQAEYAMRPFRQHQKMIESVMTPGISSALAMRDDLARQFGPMVVPTDRAAYLLEQATSLTRRLDWRRDALADLAALGTLGLGDRLTGLAAPSIAEHMKGLTTPALLGDFRNVFADSATQAFRAATVPNFTHFALNATASVARFMLDAEEPWRVRDAVAEFLAQAERFGFVSAGITAEGIRIDDDLVAAADLTAHFEQAISDAVRFPAEERLRAFLARCLVLLRNAPKPVAKALLIALGTILLWIAEGEVQEVSREVLTPARQVLMAKIRKLTGAQQAPKNESRRLTEFRVVTAKDTLNVRVYPRKSDSRILGTLTLGTVVVFVREINNWTLVTYKDGESVITGWAYTCHLRKVVLPGEHSSPASVTPLSERHE